MLSNYWCLILFVAAITLEYALSQHSSEGFSYDRIPMRPMVPEKTRPIVQTVRPITARPRRPSASQGGSRYLRRRKPGKKNLDKALLLQLMGDDYQTSWMSDEKPQKLLITIPSDEVPDIEGIPGRWAHQRLLEHTQELNLTAEFSILQPELLPYQDFVKSWLLKRSSCPVEFTWKDLGPTFWPRWVREGACMDRKGSCSFPSGMHCVPAATTTVHILRWQCRERRMTIVKKSASGGQTSPDGTVQKRRLKERVGLARKPEGAHKRRIVDRLMPDIKTSDEVEASFRRRVADLSPEQQRRKRRCDWYRVPFPITIDCFCTC